MRKPGEHAVNANPAILRPGWWHDPMQREDVHRRVHALLREGHTVRDVARRTGVSERTVGRLSGTH